MRAGSHERHFCAQNASGLARTQPERVQTLRMRAGSHREHLPECERARTNGTSESSRAQNASGHAQTPPQPLEEEALERWLKEGERAGGWQEQREAEAPRMRAGSHERHFGHFKSFMKNPKVTKHLCFISKKITTKKAGFGQHRFVEAK